jgi:transposase InsO family protein
MAENVEFLGHEVSKQGCRPGEMKTRPVTDYPVPTNVTEIRQFMGLCNFFRKFIINFSIIAEPLHVLTRKAVKFEFGAKQHQAFNILKRKLTERPILVLYDPQKQHELHTDASSKGLSGILLQRQDDELLHAVSYFSRMTTDVEKRYHSYELEILAVVESLERFKYYLVGKHFKLVTDCNSLVSTLKKKELVPRIARWVLRIQDYDFVAEHRDGTKMAHVDCLSRQPVEPPAEAEIASLKIMAVEESSVTEDWLHSLQLQDENIRRIKRSLECEEGRSEAEDEAQIRQDYKLKNHRVYRVDGEKLMWLVPKAVRWRIIKSCHDDVGHFGVDKTVKLVLNNYWFPKLRVYVKKYIKNCVSCLYNKVPKGKAEGELHNIEKVPVPFHTVHIDHLGPFPKSTRGNTHVIGYIDAFTKYIVLKACKNTSTSGAVKLIEAESTHFGLPSRIISDRGTGFTSKQFEKYCDDNNIKHVLNATKTPRANGQIERYFGTVCAALRTMTENDRKWDENLAKVQWGLNTTVNSTTNVTPQQLLFTYTPNDAAGNLLTTTIYPDLVEGMRNQEEITRMTNAVIDRIKKVQGQQKIRFDGKHRNPTVYQEDDLVLLRYDSPATGESRKLERKYRGPYLVSKVIGNDRYLVVDVPGSQQTQKPFKSIYASDRMKPWCNLEGDEDGDSDEELTEDGQQSQNGRSCYERYNDGDSFTLGFDDRKGRWKTAGGN